MPARFDRRGFLDSLLGAGFVSTVVAMAHHLIPPASGEPVTQSVVAAQASPGVFAHIMSPLTFTDPDGRRRLMIGRGHHVEFAVAIATVVAGFSVTVFVSQFRWLVS